MKENLEKKTSISHKKIFLIIRFTQLSMFFIMGGAFVLVLPKYWILLVLAVAFAITFQSRDEDMFMP